MQVSHIRKSAIHTDASVEPAYSSCERSTCSPPTLFGGAGGCPLLALLVKIYPWVNNNGIGKCMNIALRRDFSLPA
jgi:hypothetical protein